jgi:hypothetical protein
MVPLSAALKVILDPPACKFTVRVPKSAFGGGDPAAWGYLAVVLSQEGHPSEGVMHVRDVKGAARRPMAPPPGAGHHLQCFQRRATTYRQA